MKCFKATALCVLTFAIGSNVWSQEATPKAIVVPEGINDNFKNPDLDVDEWLERFEVESREVLPLATKC